MWPFRVEKYIIAWEIRYASNRCTFSTCFDNHFCFPLLCSMDPPSRASEPSRTFVERLSNIKRRSSRAYRESFTGKSKIISAKAHNGRIFHGRSRNESVTCERLIYQWQSTPYRLFQVVFSIYSAKSIKQQLERFPRDEGT
jgi:hypothetical protein